MLADSLASTKEMRCIHTEKKQAPSARPGPLGLLLELMVWALEENHGDLLALPPSWASTAFSSLGGLSSDGGLVLPLLV